MVYEDRTEIVHNLFVAGSGQSSDGSVRGCCSGSSWRVAGMDMVPERSGFHHNQYVPSNSHTTEGRRIVCFISSHKLESTESRPCEQTGADVLWASKLETPFFNHIGKGMAASIMAIAAYQYSALPRSDAMSIVQVSRDRSKLANAQIRLSRTNNIIDEQSIWICQV